MEIYDGNESDRSKVIGLVNITAHPNDKKNSLYASVC